MFGRHSLPPRPAWGHPTPHVSSPPAASYACPVGRAAETGHGAAVATWTPPHAWWPPTKSGRLLQVRRAEAGGPVGRAQVPTWPSLMASPPGCAHMLLPRQQVPGFSPWLHRAPACGPRGDPRELGSWWDGGEDRASCVGGRLGHSDPELHAHCLPGADG